jgi:hypothetical protein
LLSNNFCGFRVRFMLDLDLRIFVCAVWFLLMVAI